MILQVIAIIVNLFLENDHESHSF